MVSLATAPRGEHAIARPAVYCSEFDSSDPAEIEQWFCTAYESGWRLTNAPPRVSHRRRDAGQFGVDELELTGPLGAVLEFADRAVVIAPHDGGVKEARDRDGTSPDGPVLCAPGLGCELQITATRLTVVSVDISEVRAAAADLPVPFSADIHFVDRRARSQATSRTCLRAMDFACVVLADPDAPHQPLLVWAVRRVIAAALLECFASTLEHPPAHSLHGAPESLAKAIAYIHRHAKSGIGVNDIAASVHLTPRALQYLFRRQLDTTPMEYLRQIRLQYAHRDLVIGDRNTTVGATAARWGFAHTGRFAMLYRRVYGQSPHTTLRDGPPAS